MTQDVPPQRGPQLGMSWGTCQPRVQVWPNPGSRGARSCQALGKLRHGQGSNPYPPAAIACRDRGAPGAAPMGLQGPGWDVTRFARALLWESAGCCGRLGCANQNLFAWDTAPGAEPGTEPRRGD